MMDKNVIETTVVPSKTQITEALAGKELTDIAIEGLGRKYLILSIRGLDDKEGYEKVHKARMEMVKYRTSVEKKRKALKEDALKFSREVDAEAKRINGLLAPIEQHLFNEETKIDEEKDRIKKEAEEKEIARIQERINTLFAFGCRFDGQNYSIHNIIIGQMKVKTALEPEFDKICDEIQKAVDEENKRIEALEEARKAEENRLAKIAEAQKAERERLEAVAVEQARKEAEAKAEIERKAAALKVEEDRIRKEQEEKERKIREEQERKEGELQAERDRIEIEKAAIKEAKRREEEERALAIRIEQERKEAEEKARIEEQERIKKEEEEKSLAEIAAHKEAARLEALKPDTEKLLAFSNTIEDLLQQFPELTTQEGREILALVRTEILQVVKKLRKRVDTLSNGQKEAA